MSDESKLIDLDAIERRAKAATGTAWHWAGNTDTGEPYLATWVQGAGRCQVLSIGSEKRSTTSKAADDLRLSAREYDLGDPDDIVDRWAHDQDGKPIGDPRLQFMTDLMCVNAREIAVYEVAPEATSREDPEVYRADVVGIRHPDADFIAHSREDIDDLLAEVKRVRAERDEALAKLARVGDRARHSSLILEILGEDPGEWLAAQKASAWERGVRNAFSLWVMTHPEDAFIADANPYRKAPDATV